MLQATIFIWLLLLAAMGENHGLSPEKSQLRTAASRAFSRRRRAVLFPPGSFVKFTCSFATGLLATYPKGINFVLEEAVYFPIPGVVEDIYPKKFLPKTTTKKPEKLPDTYVYIPGTDWRFKAQTLPKPKWRQPPPKTQRIDDDSHANPYKWQQWNQKQKWQNFKWKEVDPSKAKWSKWTTPSPKWEWKPPKEQAWQSHHYYGHRDRRAIGLFDRFTKLSSLFGIDVKSCILRTICDSKRLLLPPGYSMLQDMLRVVFTMPRLDGLEDEYTRIMDREADDCALELKSNCNMNLLIWLLSGRVE